ncbi:MAG: histidine kinase [Holophagaceae bacterium]
MPGPAPDTALWRRLRSKALWGAFAFVVLAVQPFLAWKWQAMGTPLLRRAGDELSHMLMMGSLVWLSPVPWEWRSPSGKPILSWPAALRAFLMGEAVMLAITYLDSLVSILAGLKPSSLGVYLLDLCLWGPAFFLVGLLTSRQARLEHEREGMREKVVEAQVRHLQGQLNPHVLFNALNSLAELLQQDPGEAERCLRSMASLLRRILEASEVSSHPLGEERALVEDYLAVEAVRHGRRLRVEWDWDAALDGLPVMPLLLQPLVENALKHGISRTRRGGCLRLAAWREGARLRLRVANEGPAPAAAPGPRAGIGLKNLRARLALAYGDSAFLDFRREEPWTLADLDLLLPEHAGAP